MIKTEDEPTIGQIVETKKKYSKKKDYYGLIPILGDDDTRILKFDKQYEERGFDDTVTWNLYSEISKFIIPRLKRFKEVTNGYPPNITFKEWEEIIDKMIYAHEIEIKDFPTDEEWEKHMEGLELFNTYYRSLWW